MKEQGFTRRGLAEQAGLEESTLKKIVKEEAPNPTLRTLLKIAQVLNCSLDELVYEKDDIQLISNNPTPINMEVLLDCADGVTRWYKRNNTKLTDYNLWLSQVTMVYNECMEEKLQELPDNVVNIVMKYGKN